MVSLIKRNLKLYFNNKSIVFFSMLAALISFLLYLLFLKNGMQQSLKNIPNSIKLLDSWLMGGTLSTTAITTVSVSLSQMVYDKENNVMADIYLTDVSPFSIQISYLISAVIIGTIMQTLIFIIMNAIFNFTDKIGFGWQLLPQVFIIAIFSSIVWTAFYMIFYGFIRRSSSLSGINSVIGTAAGFFALVYIPMNLLPKIGKDIIQVTPSPYISSIYRQLLMHNQIKQSFQAVPTSSLNSFKNDMGINLKFVSNWYQAFNMLLIFLLIFAFLDVLAFILRRMASNINY